MRSLVTLSLLAVLCAAPSLAKPVLWKLDFAHTQAAFKIKHLGISSVTGTLSNPTGTVLLDEENLGASKVEVALDVSTIDTGIEKRDDHLKGPDFFDVAKFPKMTFTSTKITKTDDGYDVAGDLTMHGVTKPTVLKVGPLSPEQKNPAGSTVRGTEGAFKVNRKDFGLMWNKAIEGGGVLVGDEVKVELAIVLIKARDQPN